MVVAAVATLRARTRAEQRPRPPPEHKRRRPSISRARRELLTRPVSIRLSARSFQTFLVSTRRPWPRVHRHHVHYHSSQPIPNLRLMVTHQAGALDGNLQFTHRNPARARRIFDHDGLHARGRPVDRLLGGVGLFERRRSPRSRRRPTRRACRPPRRGALTTMPGAAPPGDAAPPPSAPAPAPAAPAPAAYAPAVAPEPFGGQSLLDVDISPPRARRGLRRRRSLSRPRRARPVDHGAEPVQGGRRHLGVLHVRGDDADDAAAVQVRPVQRDATLPRL